MSLVTREFNYPRKSHRVDIPLLIQVDGKVYKTHDWSMTGVGILDLDREIGEQFSARLIMPLSDASMQLDVALICRNRRSNITGCEFDNLSNRNRRVLRHFIELSMEGRLDILEDLAADLTVPDIESPLETALALSEEEEISLLAKFRSRASMALILGVLFALFLSFTLWYNLVFLYKTVGVVSGDFLEVSSARSGVIGAVLHRPGDLVHPGDILFELSSIEIEENLRQKKEQLEQVLAELQLVPVTREDSDLLAALKEELGWKEKEYRGAARLYKDGVISIKDFEFVRNSWSRARINFFRQQWLSGEQGRSSTRQRQELEKTIRELQQGIAVLNRRLEHLRIRSRITARVYTAGYQAGEYVSGGEVVMVLAGDGKPSILFKMPSTQVAKITLGTPVRFFSYATGTSYIGHVGAIGYKAISPRTSAMQEVSLDQTAVRVDLAKPIPGLLPNSRVKVWVRKRLDLPGFLDRVFPFSFSSASKKDQS
jgi:multidrug resistance efflux pump